MRTIIAGSRYVFDSSTVDWIIAKAAAQGIVPSVVLCGGAKGVDDLGKAWATDQGIPVEDYAADWNKHGKAAGPIRNGEMVEDAQALIAVTNGDSRGTRNCISQAMRAGLRVFIMEYTDAVVAMTDESRAARGAGKWTI